MKLEQPKFTMIAALFAVSVSCMPEKGMETDASQAQLSRPPIIDMHLHTIPAAWSAVATPMNPVTGRPSTATTGADLLPQTLMQMDAYDVRLAVLSGPLGSVQEWTSAASGRFVGAPQFPMTHTTTLDLEAYLPSPDEIRQAVQTGQVGALGEITAQYAGMIPSDPILDPYFALAEELDLPVGIHTGKGTIRILSAEDQEKFRVDYGNPKWINDVVARYPRLRIYLMHAGYPFLEDTIALMTVYTDVYADLSRINWSVPRPAFHDYLKRLIDAGLESRLMFGSDGVGFPEALGLAIEGVESAEFLTEQQKEDIFYNNAARFLRMDQRPQRYAIEANHRVFFPDGEGPFPTVVAIPGCSGVSLDQPATDKGRPGDEADRLFRRHYAGMAGRLRDGGFGVVLVDYLTAENVANTCGGEISHERVGEYVAASLEFARALPQVDLTRLYVVGWSHGGAGVFAWLQALGEQVPPVAGAVAVYPGCNSRDIWVSTVPVLVLLGEADDITPPESCDRILRRLPDGTQVQVRRYADARHGFDLTEGPEVLSIGGGMTVGRNPSAGLEAWEEIFAFLGEM